MDGTPLTLDLSGYAHISDLAVDTEGNIFLADEFNHRIGKFGPQGNKIAEFGKPGSEAGCFHYPTGLALHEGQLFVTDSWNHRVQVFDTEGRLQFTIGGPGSEEGRFITPLDAVVGPDGLLWVVDSDNHRVQCFEPAGGELVRIYLGGSLNNDEVIVNDPERKCVTGLPFYYPRQIFRSGDTVFVRDMDKIVRISPRLIDDFRLKIAKADHTIIVASDHMAVLFDRQAGEATLLNFGNFQTAPLFSIEPNTTVFGRAGRLWLFGVEQATVPMLRPEAFLNETVADAVLRITPMDPETRRRHLEAAGALSQLSADRPETLTEQLFSRLPDFFPLADALLNPRVRFRTESCKPLYLYCLLANRLPPELVNAEGRRTLDSMERYLESPAQTNNRLIDCLPSLLHGCSTEQRLTFCDQVAARIRYAFAELYDYRQRLQADALSLLQEAHDEVDGPAVRRLDGCLFHVDRMALHLFRIFRRFFHCLGHLGIEGAMTAQSPAGFFCAAYVNNFCFFEPHLLNCLHRMDPARFPFPKDPAEALTRFGPAWEGAARAAAKLLTAGNRIERKKLKARQLAWHLCAPWEPTYRREGRLYKIAGTPLQVSGRFLYFLKEGQSGNWTSLFEEIPTGPLWHPQSVYLNSPMMRARFPDWEHVNRLEALQLTQKEDEPAGFHPNYVAVVVQRAYNLVLNDGDVEEALNLLEKIKGHPEYDNTRAKIFANRGELDKAAAACRNANLDFWPLTLTRGIIHLYRCEWQAGIDLFEHPPGDFPEHLAALYLAISHRTARHFDVAEELFKKLEPGELPMTDYHLGILYRVMGRDQEALDAFKRQEKTWSFEANQMELALTLRKPARQDAYEAARTALPKQASLRWNGKRFSPEHPSFTEVVDHYLRVERNPLPKAGRIGPEHIAHFWVAQSQNLTPMFFVFHDHLFHVYQPLPPLNPGTEEGGDIAP